MARVGYLIPRPILLIRLCFQSPRFKRAARLTQSPRVSRAGIHVYMERNRNSGSLISCLRGSRRGCIISRYYARNVGERKETEPRRFFRRRSPLPPQPAAYRLLHCCKLSPTRLEEGRGKRRRISLLPRLKLSFNGRNVVARASKSKPRFRSTLSVSIRSSSGQSWDELSIARVLKGRARREAQGEINLDRGGRASAPSFITARQRNPRIDTKLAVGRPVVALSWLTFVSVSRAKGGGGGLENGRRKRGSLPDGGAEGPESRKGG